MRKLLAYVVLGMICTGLVGAQGPDPEGLEDDSSRSKRFGKKRGKAKKNGRRGKMHRFGKKGMKAEMKKFFEGLPEDQREKAQKVVQYLHTSHEVAKNYAKSKQMDKAVAVMEKRIRLKLPASFTAAPPVIKNFKVLTRMEIGKMLMRAEKFPEAIKHLEQAREEINKAQGLPPMMAMGLRNELMRAYKKAGMEGKATALMEDSLKEAEAGLDFE